MAQQTTSSGGDEGLSFWLKKQLAAFEEKFVVADKDKSGFLSYGEVCEVLRNAGFKGTDEDLQAIFKFADANKDSKVSRSEYVQALKKAPKISLAEMVLRRAFTKLDLDGSGFLSRSELTAATASEDAGVNVPAAKLSEMLIALVTDSDQKFSYEEFLGHFKYNQTATLLRDLFNKIDADKSGFLTKQEIVAAVKADDELAFQAANLSELLITFTKGGTDKINYEEFARIVANQAKK